MSTAHPDPLADVLWAAREERIPVADVQAWGAVDHARAAAISADLYGRCGLAEATDEVTAWKMGALDVPTREKLGLLGPLVAPVLPGGMHTGAEEVRLSLGDLVAPKLEAEVGVLIEDGRPRMVPCVEVADCRFRGWDVPPACAVADFGLQGSMVFGSAVDHDAEVSVTVRHDGSPVGAGSDGWSAVIERLAILPCRLASSVHVATGSITPMFPARPGTWEFDFGGAGRIVVVLD